MSTISLSGLSTGIDTEAIVQQLVAASSGTLNRLQARESEWTSKRNAFNTLETRLEALQAAVDDIRTTADLRAYTATTNDAERLTLDVGAGAGEGAHDVTVNQLASAEREVHDGVAALDTLVGEGTLAYTYNGTTRTVQTTTETTLEDLRDLINNDAGNPGVTASILEYDAGGDQVYHLVLGAGDTGADYTVAIEDAQTTLDGTGGTVDFRTATFTETQSAQDAQVRVDGYPAADWITRSSNTINDILPGVTLHLHAPTDAGETVRISINRDTEGLKDKVNAFVQAYNSATDYIQEQTAYDEATGTAGILMGEYTTSYVRHQTRLPIIEAAPGFLDGTDPYILAGEVGLSIDRYGTLELDEEAFDDALAEDYLGVLNLFGADRTGASDSDNLRFYGATSATEAGEYDVKAVFDAGTLVSAQIKGADEGEDAWRDATVDGNTITGDADHPEAGLQITADYSGTGTVEASVRVRQGVAGRMYDLLDDLLDPLDGALANVDERCANMLDSLEENIERQEERLAAMEERLTLQFARLESTLSQIQAQQSALTSLFYSAQ
ncbi:MAG: flagellar filament capping protein FliD [Phycisphaerae bacterium]